MCFVIDKKTGQKSITVKSQADLAKRMGFSRQYFNRVWKEGKREFILKKDGRVVQVEQLGKASSFPKPKPKPQAPLADNRSGMNRLTPTPLSEAEWDVVVEKLKEFVKSIPCPFPFPEVERSGAGCEVERSEVDIPEADIPEVNIPEVDIPEEDEPISLSESESMSDMQEVPDEKEKRHQGGLEIPLGKKWPFGPKIGEWLSANELQVVLDAFQEDGLSFLPAGFRVKGYEEKVGKDVETRVLLVDPKLKDSKHIKTFKDVEGFFKSRALPPPDLEEWESDPEMGVFPMKMFYPDTQVERWWWRFTVIRKK